MDANSSNESPSGQELFEALTTPLIGAGIVVMALFPLAIPIVVLTIVFIAPLALPLVIVGLLAALLAIPVLVIRRLGRVGAGLLQQRRSGGTSRRRATGAAGPAGWGTPHRR